MCLRQPKIPAIPAAPVLPPEPLPPTPVPDRMVNEAGDPAKKAAEDSARLMARRQSGRAATLLTSPLGVVGETTAAPTARKVLLGG